MIDRERLAALLGRERDSFAERHPRSRAAYRPAGANLLGNVPMTWMNKAAGRFPVYLAEARGATVVDLDGHRYVDLCLGDTAAMAGHSPAPTVAAVQRRYAEAGGATAMLPDRGRGLGRGRAGPPVRGAAVELQPDRHRRQPLGHPAGPPGHRPAQDPGLQLLLPRHRRRDASSPSDADGATSREGNVGAPVDPAVTTRVVEFNDLDALDRELANGDVACVLMEPALTNIGIVLPAPGYLEGVRELTRRHGTLLVNDETHTLSAGPGGCTLAWGLEPDLVTVGKAIAGGIAAGAYGVSAEVAERVAARPRRRPDRHRRGRRHPGRQRPLGGGDAGHPRARPHRRRPSST